MSQTLLTALQNPDLYDHPVSGFTLIETHISWVLLTGDYVYKVKKPVNFGFLDFSTLAQREHFCREEVRLNRRIAPDLYLDVIAVTGSEDAPTLGGEGPTIEYMVKTRQFRQQDLLSNLQRDGGLTSAHIDELAQVMARFHGQIEHAELDTPFGAPEQVHAPVAQNFEQIRPFLSSARDLGQLDALEQWANTTYQRLIPQIAERKAGGMVRECHGDVYLDNVTLIDGQVTLFDCIEFNEPFRWTDVMADVAFMSMDLEDRGLHALSNRFVSAYLEQTGDYQGLAVLNYYKAYRAMVRAKVALFGLNDGMTEEQRAATMQRYYGYTALAESYSELAPRFGLLTVGVSGSGKSTLAVKLVEQLGAIRIRSDVERKRLFGDEDNASLESGLYSPERSEQTYRRLANLAAQILASGYPVIVDATHLKQNQRDLVRDAIENQGAPCLILQCEAPQEVIEHWLEQRQQQGGDISDAGIEVMHHQLTTRQPLSDEEAQLAVQIDTSSEEAMNSIAEQLRQRL